MTLYPLHVNFVPRSIISHPGVPIVVHIICCSRLSGFFPSRNPSNPRRLGGSNVSTSLPAINLSTINAQAPTAPDANIPDDGVNRSRDDSNVREARFLTVPRAQFLTVDNMKQAVSIETIDSDGYDHAVY